MTGTDTFSMADAMLCGQWASMAYLSGPFPANFKLVNMLPRADVQCLVARLTTATVFAFRGTDDITKWIMDAKIAFTQSGPAGECSHLGFFEAVSAIWEALKPDAIQAEAGRLPIITTGHSAGAAMARQFTWRLAQSGIRAARSITFGEPRSFNRAGARAYDALGIPTWRVIDEDDIVCRVPWRLGLYRHVASSAFIDYWGRVGINEPWYAHLSSDIHAAWMEWRIKRQVAAVADHLMARYLDRMTMAAQKLTG